MTSPQSTRPDPECDGDDQYSHLFSLIVFGECAACGMCQPPRVLDDPIDRTAAADFRDYYHPDYFDYPQPTAPDSLRVAVLVVCLLAGVLLYAMAAYR